jgi:hypothetical protein
MSLKRDNRYRQSKGKLLELTKPQQELRQEWQAANPHLEWWDTMIVTMGKWNHGDGIMSWGLAVPFDIELGKFRPDLADMPGSIKVHRVLGQSNAVRTDTTDRLSRAKHSRQAILDKNTWA